ncbi:hypothetical protein [Leifsonia sp. 1010]|uniref:hypothetical protein n=1 Tax=Leifsonia sp. 1010 TaxID=2817769 RepID=UPI002862907F|nr:hypothetical protein [Leifsonia sp. 1010]MDR6612216.1 hypothetical protein [Leifsonia sp. 1010]
MWDTAKRIPFDPELLTERSDPAARIRLMALLLERPGISVDELHRMRLPGLFADLRSFHRAGLIRVSTTPPRFFERETRVYPVCDGTGDGTAPA